MTKLFQPATLFHICAFCGLKLGICLHSIVASNTARTKCCPRNSLVVMTLLIVLLSAGAELLPR